MKIQIKPTIEAMLIADAKSRDTTPTERLHTILFSYFEEAGKLTAAPKQKRMSYEMVQATASYHYRKDDPSYHEYAARKANYDRLNAAEGWNFETVEEAEAERKAQSLTRTKEEAKLFAQKHKEAEKREGMTVVTDAEMKALMELAQQP